MNKQIFSYLLILCMIGQSNQVLKALLGGLDSMRKNLFPTAMEK